MTNVATIRDWHYYPPTNLRRMRTLNQSVDECLEVLVKKGIRYSYTEGEDYITVFSSVNRPYVYYWADGQWASYRKKAGASKHFTHSIKEFTDHYLNRYSAEKVVKWPKKAVPKRKTTAMKAAFKKAKTVKKKSSESPPVVKKEKAKLALLDIETTNLRANFGYILCVCIKIVGEDDITTFAITDYPEFKKDPTNDKPLIEDVFKVLEKCSGFITHYGRKFDVPFLQTRALVHGLGTLPSDMPHIDTWLIARYKMKLNSNRLDTIAKHLQLDVQKTSLDGPTWVRAMSGDKDAIKYIIDHCIHDVLVLEQVYLRLRPLMTNHPNISLIDSERTANGKFIPDDGTCPACASQKTWNNGKVATLRRLWQRRTCGECGVNWKIPA